jgi:hypothetical protein
MRMGLDEFTGNLVIVPRQGLRQRARRHRIRKAPVHAHDREAEGAGGRRARAGGDPRQRGAALRRLENDRHSVTAFLNALAGALKGRAILLLAHPSRGLNSEFSGSSAWENVARTRLYLGASLPDQKTGRGAIAGRALPEPAQVKLQPKDYRRCVYRDGVLIPDEPDEGGGIVSIIKASNAEKVSPTASASSQSWACSKRQMAPPAHASCRASWTSTSSPKACHAQTSSSHAPTYGGRQGGSAQRSARQPIFATSLKSVMSVIIERCGK